MEPLLLLLKVAQKTIAVCGISQSICHHDRLQSKGAPLRPFPLCFLCL